jgi:hypothetical protein
MAKDSILIENMMSKRNQGLGGNWSSKPEMKQRGGISPFCIFAELYFFST